MTGVMEDSSIEKIMTLSNLFHCGFVRKTEAKKEKDITGDYQPDSPVSVSTNTCHDLNISPK